MENNSTKQLQNAKKRAQDITETAKEQYKIEIDRLKLFNARFNAFVNKTVQNYPSDQTRKLVVVSEMITEILMRDEEDFYTEYNDYILTVGVVDSVEEAIAHINEHGTKHSEAIVTEDAAHAEWFLRSIDAAAVYHNASTRFTDGFVFGLGAEIGISTQKLHARGPMGLRELTTAKFIINGNGQCR